MTIVDLYKKWFKDNDSNFIALTYIKDFIESVEDDIDVENVLRMLEKTGTTPDNIVITLADLLNNIIFKYTVRYLSEEETFEKTKYALAYRAMHKYHLYEGYLWYGDKGKFQLSLGVEPLIQGRGRGIENFNFKIDKETLRAHAHNIALGIREDVITSRLIDEVAGVYDYYETWFLNESKFYSHLSEHLYIIKDGKSVFSSRAFVNEIRDLQYESYDKFMLVGRSDISINLVELTTYSIYASLTESLLPEKVEDVDPIQPIDLKSGVYKF